MMEFQIAPSDEKRNIIDSTQIQHDHFKYTDGTNYNQNGLLTNGVLQSNGSGHPHKVTNDNECTFGQGYHQLNGSSYTLDTHQEDDVNQNNNTNAKETFKFGSLSRERKLLLIFCVLSHLMSGLSTSLLAPFYPQVAEEKGMSLTLVGFTFSLFPLTNFFTSPIFSSYMTSIGPKFLLISGLMVGGVCNILYGALGKCPSGTPFIVSSLVCRFVEALGFSAYVNANLTLSAKEFSDHAATVMAFIQMASELGLMLGPAVGGALFDAGGFGTPFYVVGTLVVINGLLLYLIIPSSITTERTKAISKRSLICNSLVQVSMITIATGSLGIGFLESTLSNHLSPLNLSTTVIGLIFAICPALFTISSPIYGYLTDARGRQSYLIVFGHFVFGFGLLLVGPARIFSGMELELWSVIIGLILIGVSFGCALIPTMKCLIIGALECGGEDNTETYAAVSGINTSMYFLGSFLGPLLGSALIQVEGYAFAYTTIGGWCIFMCVLCLVAFVYRHLVGSS